MQYVVHVHKEGWDIKGETGQEHGPEERDVFFNFPSDMENWEGDHKLETCGFLL